MSIGYSSEDSLCYLAIIVVQAKSSKVAECVIRLSITAYSIRKKFNNLSIFIEPARITFSVYLIINL